MPLSGLLGADSAIVDLADCALTDLEVDAFLSDLADICTVTRGELPPGSFTGRVIHINGTNAAPTAAGLIDVVKLNNIGITVNHS